MNPILALAIKDLRLLVRDKAALFFAIGFPLIMAVFFGTIFGGGGGSEGPSGIRIVTVDEDATEGSAAFLAAIDADSAFRATRAESEVVAVDAVRRGTASAAVMLRPGFGQARERVMWGDPASIDVVYDPSRGAESAMIEGLLTRTAFEGLAGLFSDSTTMRKSNAEALANLDQNTEMGPLARLSLKQLLRDVDRFYAQGEESWMTDGDDGGSALGGMNWQPVEITKRSVRDAGDAEAASSPQSGYAVSFPQGVIWALLGVSAGFGISLVSERSSGTMRRLRVAPVSRGDVLLGKALACFAATLTASLLLLLLASGVFGVRPTSVPLLGLGVVCAGVCFTGIMMLLSVLGRSEQAAAGIGWAVLLMLGMFGGAMVPLFVMPGWMQSMASLSPVKWAILAIEGPLWRGFGASDMLLPCGILLTVGAIAFALGAGLFGKMQES